MSQKNRIEPNRNRQKPVRHQFFRRTLKFPRTCSVDWVVLLGPDNFGDEGLYQYSVITNPERLQLYVLARDVPGFRADYQEEVSPRVQSTKPVKIFNSFILNFSIGAEVLL